MPQAEVFQVLKSSLSGLREDESLLRRQKLGVKGSDKSDLSLLLSQFTNPIVGLLIFTALLSFYLEQSFDSIVIFSIILISGLLGFWQERGARDAVSKMLDLVEIKAEVKRDGKMVQIPATEVVRGDIVFLSAGDAIPADCLLLEANTLSVDESALTGETFPAVKDLNSASEWRERCLFMGTHVVCGSGLAVAVNIGADSQFGKICRRLTVKPQEPEFEHGLRIFGYFLLEMTLILVLGIFAVNVFLKRSILDSLMFSLALAVGLTPQLLPAIVSVNLAKGAKRMAQSKVLVKRLSAIESFGSMNVLCSDKTGTITEGVVKLVGAVNIKGEEDPKVLFLSYLNSSLETGFKNPIDQAIIASQELDISAYKKLAEIPYDFVRKRLSICAELEGRSTIITKGALNKVLEVCKFVELGENNKVSLETVQAEIELLFDRYSQQGLRVLGLAYKEISQESELSRDVECDMIFVGCLVFEDPPKLNVERTIRELEALGVRLKIITGDNHKVAMTIGERIGIENPKILLSSAMRRMSDRALYAQVNDVDIFAEVEPHHKERIITALKKAGNVVGYIGDGINDASALHVADVGISVNNAVDVAKEAAQLVMLEHDLEVLIDGIKEGRIAFANTMKYVYMATSANFGNMFSMAISSTFLPFLPLLPKQVLLTNMLTDLPEMAIATDSVDKELIDYPERWSLSAIRKFMLVFGCISSVFDFATFAVLLWVLNASQEQFRTGWFMESVVSASLIVLVIRTRKSIFISKPSRTLTVATISCVLMAVACPFSPLGALFGFSVLPWKFLPLLVGIIVIYVGTAELAKKIFYKHLSKVPVRGKGSLAASPEF